MRYFSYGGGIQSNAIMVLQANGIVHFDKFIFANVGEDSENHGTLKYIEQIAKPYMLKHGIEFVEIRRRIRDKTVTLYEYLMANNKTIPIPAYLKSGAPGNRNCTLFWKILPIAKYTKQNGANKNKKDIMGIGISLDEYQRMKDSRINWQTNEYPLIDLKISRTDCRKIIQEEGLPVPPKSSCYFCPFHKISYWNELKASQLEIFNKAVIIEHRINEKRELLNRDEMYLTQAGKPLDKIIGEQLKFDFENEICDSGYCFV